MDSSFRPYLEELDRSWYRDDDFLRRLLGRHRGRTVRAFARRQLEEAGPT